MEVSRATCTRTYVRARGARGGGGGGGGTRNIISAPSAECAIALSSTSSSSGQTIVSTTEINKESGTSIECSFQDYVESSICHVVFNDFFGE